MDDWQPQLIMLAQVALAGLLGGVVGLERELRGKAAGVRTQMLVAGAAALLVELGVVMSRQWDASDTGGVVSTDPLRIMEAIITGISFIGAGTIIFRKGDEQPEGITTAASILFTAGIGLAVGINQFVLAVALTVLALVILSAVGKVEGLLLKRRKTFEQRRGAEGNAKSPADPHQGEAR